MATTVHPRPAPGGDRRRGQRPRRRSRPPAPAPHRSGLPGPGGGASCSCWVVYPTVYTIVRSLFDRAVTSSSASRNYKTLFTTSVLLTAIKNNAIWVLVVPALVTAIGLVFAVLTEKVRWSVAFKTAVFMPMAISLFAAGVIWHIMYQQDPSRRGPSTPPWRACADAFAPAGPLSGATPVDQRAQRLSRAGPDLAAGGAARAGDPAGPDRRSLRATCPRTPCRPCRRPRPPALSTASSGATSRPAAARRARSDKGELGLPGRDAGAEERVRRHGRRRPPRAPTVTSRSAGWHRVRIT